MEKTKQCKKCHEELPANTDYFYKVKSNNDGLHGTCKKCRIKQASKLSLKRRAKGKHLIHNLVCDWCGKCFKAETNHRRFCSTDCQYTWQRESEEYKEIHRNNGLKPGEYNQYGNPKEREQRFKEQFEKLNPNFKYHSEYVGADDNFKSECRVCGHIQERNAQAGRPSNRDVEITCKGCIENANQERKLEAQAIREQREKEKELRAYRQRLLASNRYWVECQECGKKFLSKTKVLYCDSDCRIKRNNRVNYLRRRRRVAENGKVNWDISIERIIKRDGDKCYLCGERVNLGDFEQWEDGTFIAGNDYPSIDHVLPISKGGTHTWGNVKLAHRQCNSVKSNTLPDTHRASLRVEAA